MRIKIQLWGNSLALRIPKYITKQMQINNGSNVDISMEEEKIIIKPIKDKKESLEYYLSQINENNIHREENLGEPEGNEVW